MKKFVVIALSLMFVATFTVNAADLVKYLPGNADPSVLPTFVNAELTGADLSRGAGIIYNSGGDFNSRHWTETSLAAAETADDYIEWGFTVPVGKSVTISNIYIRYDRSGTGPTDLQIQINGSAVYTDNAVSGSSSNNEITGLEATQSGLTGNVAIRLYGWNASATTGTFDVEDTSTWDGSNGLIVDGFVIPEPATFGLIGLALLFFRRK